MKLEWRCVITISSRWLRTSHSISTMPISGRDCESRADRIVRRTFNRSPGRTGFTQLTSSQPGAPSAAVSQQEFVAVHPHQDDAGVPARSDQVADLRVGGRLGVDVERLRIVLAREGDDLVGRHQPVAVNTHLARREIFEIEQAHRHRAFSWRSGNAARRRRRRRNPCPRAGICRARARPPRPCRRRSRRSRSSRSG